MKGTMLVTLGKKLLGLPTKAGGCCGAVKAEAPADRAAAPAETSCCDSPPPAPVAGPTGSDRR